MSGPFDYLAILLRQSSREQREATWAPMSPRERHAVSIAYERLYQQPLPLAISAPTVREGGYISAAVAFGDRSMLTRPDRLGKADDL